MNTYFNILTDRLLGVHTILGSRPISRFEPTDQTVNPRLDQVSSFSSYSTEPEAADGGLEPHLTVESLAQPQETPSTSHPEASVEERLSQVIQKLPIPVEQRLSHRPHPNLSEESDFESLSPSQTSQPSLNPREAFDSRIPSLSQTSSKDVVNQPQPTIPQSQPSQSSSANVPALGNIKSQRLNHAEISSPLPDAEIGLSEESTERAIQSQPLNRRPPFANREPETEAILRTSENSALVRRFEEVSILSQVAPEPVKLISPRERPLQRHEKKPSSSVTSAPNQTTSLPPPIQVTIGRIEVKAVSPPAAPARPPSVPTAPTLSLEEYLKQREGTG